MNKKYRQKVMKLVIKVIDENTERMKWVHVCYINEKLYLTFVKTMRISREDVADYLRVWIKDEFRIDLTMSTKSDIAIFKALVIDKYKRLYPSMYFNDLSDDHGWIRIWISEKMEQELEKNGRKL